MSPVVRDAVPADAGRIAEIHVRAWQVAYRRFVDDAVLDDPALLDHRREQWVDSLPRLGPRAAVLVAEDASDLLGFCFLGTSDDEDAGPDTGMVKSLYLDPDVWRGGVGTRLDAAAAGRFAANGFVESTLWAVIGNDRAAAFYEKRGWRRDGTVRSSPHAGFQGTTDERWHRAV